MVDVEETPIAMEELPQEAIDRLYQEPKDFYAKGEYDKAIVYNEKALAIQLKVLGRSILQSPRATSI